MPNLRIGDRVRADEDVFEWNAGQVKVVEWISEDFQEFKVEGIDFEYTWFEDQFTIIPARLAWAVPPPVLDDRVQRRVVAQAPIPIIREYPDESYVYTVLYYNNRNESIEVYSTLNKDHAEQEIRAMNEDNRLEVLRTVKIKVGHD